jgi:Flp pilus assembly pilin Flp
MKSPERAMVPDLGHGQHWRRQGGEPMTDETAEIDGRWRRWGDAGANLVEYAFLVALIAIACLVSVNLLGQNNSKSIDNTADSIHSATN